VVATCETPPPTPRRSGFIRPIDDEDDDEAEEPRDDATESRAEKR
jgi:hypothetical protein